MTPADIKKMWAAIITGHSVPAHFLAQALYEAIRLLSLNERIEQELALHRADLDAAAKGLSVPTPYPGTPMAKVIAANRFLNAALEGARAGADKADLAKLRERSRELFLTNQTLAGESCPQLVERRRRELASFAVPEAAVRYRLHLLSLDETSAQEWAFKAELCLADLDMALNKFAPGWKGETS